MVTVNGGAFEPESPKEIVRTVALNYTHAGGDYQTWAVSADGKRVLSLQLVGGAVNAAGDTANPDPPLSITVAVNWASSLRK